MRQMKLLTPKEVARALGVTDRTIARWCREGKIEGVKVGRLWRIRPDDLKVHLMAQKRWTG